MVKVRIEGEDTRKDENGIAHVSWSEAQAMVAAGNAEILQGDAVEEDTSDGEEPDLENMTRDELDALARERGLDPSDYRTKADVIAALRG